MNEIEIQRKLSLWLKNHFKSSDLLIDKEVRLKLSSELSNFRVDLVAVQSKSNVIHAFEIKSRLNPSSINSAVWQIESIYGNYKWLVVTESFTSTEILNRLKEKGFGLLVFSSSKRDFKVQVQPSYIDGNFMRYYPTVKEKWNNKGESWQ